MPLSRYLMSVAQRVCHPCQRGGIKGRISTDNVIDLESSIINWLAFARDEVSLALFDIKAAFPSLSHEFLLMVLKRIMMDESALRMVEELYRENVGVLRIRSSATFLIQILSGIRQGCPCSGALWAIGFDCIIRFLINRLSASPSRLVGLADDLALAMRFTSISLPVVVKAFDCIRDATLLEINGRKTQFVPFWGANLSDARRLIESIAPSLCGLQVSHSALYIGLRLGPEAHALQWCPVAGEMVRRSRSLKSMHGGFSQMALFFNLLIASLHGYIGAFFAPDRHLLFYEEVSLATVFSIPLYSIRVGILRAMKHFGFPVAIRDAFTSSRAARYRLACRSPEFFRAWEQLDAAFDSDDALIRFPLEDWLKRTACWSLKQNKAELEAIPAVVNLSPEVKVQRAVHGILLQSGSAAEASKLMDARLKRFRASTAHDFHRCVQVICSELPPQVAWSVMRTACYAWLTSHRFGVQCVPCLFGCEGGADSFNHYVQCSSLHCAVTAVFPKVDSVCGCLPFFLFDVFTLHRVDPAVQSETVLYRSLVTHLCLAAYNACRHERYGGSVSDLLHELACRTARGSRKARALLLAMRGSV